MTQPRGAAGPAPTTGPAAPEPETRRDQPRSTQLLNDVLRSSTLVSVLAVVIALVLGGLLIAASDEGVQEAAGYFFSRPIDLFRAAGSSVLGAYTALFQGSVYNPGAPSFERAIRPLTETLTVSVPLILAGLGLGIGFRAGLFNIGAQGQIILGGVFAGYVGFSFDLPAGLHLLLAVVGSAIGGGLWAGIAGVLKARTGANEVIVTIMLNNIAIYLIGYLLTLAAFRRGESNNPISPPIESTALYPLLLGSGFRLHLGFLVALAAAVAVWWLMERSRLGFGFKAVGANPHAARTAGISVEHTYVWVMVIAGALAGLGGSAQVLGTEKVLTAGVAASFGFDAITVALLGRSKPLGTVLAGLLFGALRAGGFVMQATTSTPIDLILVLQSLVVLLIAAPPLVRAVFRLPSPGRLRRPPSVNPTPLTPAKEV